MTILVVDDHAPTRQVLRVLLEASGYEVVEAADGEEALGAFSNVAFDAVITDILMPRMDGHRLCHALRSDPRTRQVPIVFYTATYTSEDDERTALALGADRFVRKPAPASQILGALSEVLARKAEHAPKPSASPPGLELMQRYSQRLVEALEAKNLELEHQKSALQASERRFRQVFESANDAMFLVRLPADGRPERLADVNRVACELLGVAREELLARTMRDFVPEVAESFAEIAMRLRGEQRTVFERVIVAKDGRRVPVEVSARRVEADGEPVGIAALRDITERKQAERLRSAVNLSLSHELNTPLNGIIGMAQLLDGATDPGEVREALAGIGEAAKRLQALVQRNLDYARLELLSASTVKPAMAGPDETRDLAPVAQKIARDFAAAQGRDADLRLEINTLMSALAERWLHRLLTELLDNAFKFSAPGQPVRVRAATEAGRVQLVVQDAGRGMNADQVASLGAFIQFGRAQHEQQGIGLGLHLARQIAQLHGGTLQIHTAPDEGAIVVVTMSATARPEGAV